jgi:hypothetical protein
LRLLPFYLIEGHLFHSRNRYDNPGAESSLGQHWTGVLKIGANGTAVESRDFQNARRVLDRLGSHCRRLVWPVSECPEETRPVKAPGKHNFDAKTAKNFRFSRMESDNPQ